MAEQTVNVVIRQQSSGSGLSITASWGSDGHPVTHKRWWVRQLGSYTVDALLVHEIEHAIRELVTKSVDQGQLF